VTDGFAGNVLLKCLEGVTKFLFSKIKQVLTKGARAKVAAVLVGGKIKKMRAAYVEEAQAGTIFLGLKRPVIKAHGNSDVRIIASALAYAKTVTGLDLGEKIEAAIKEVEKIIGAAND
jgi:glycerol-3-phosphate acyltransferase PlsX